MAKLAIIDSDLNLSTLLKSLLEADGHVVEMYNNYESLKSTKTPFCPDLMIVDYCQHDRPDQLDTIKELQTRYDAMLLVTDGSKGNKAADAVLNLKRADYIHKPYEHSEIKARIHKLLQSEKHAACYEIGCYHFDVRTRSLRRNGHIQQLSPMCFGVLLLVCKNMGHFVLRDEIIKNVWKEKNWEIKERSLHNILSQLRRMLKDEPGIVLESKSKAGVRLQKADA